MNTLVTTTGFDAKHPVPCELATEIFAGGGPGGHPFRGFTRLAARRLVATASLLYLQKSASAAESADRSAAFTMRALQ